MKNINIKIIRIKKKFLWCFILITIFLIKLYKSRERFLHHPNEEEEIDSFYDDFNRQYGSGENRMINYGYNTIKHSELLNLLLNDKENSSNGKVEENEIENTIKQLFLYSLQHPLQPQQFEELRQRVELHTKLWHTLFGTYPNEFKVSENSTEPFQYKEILIKKTKFLSLKWKRFSSLSDYKKLLAMVHESLYSWLYGFRYSSLSDILKSSNGKGIVICTGDKYFKYVHSTINSLRSILHCQLPIEITYLGDNDLSSNHRKLLEEEFDNIYFNDISNTFKNSIVGIEGWAIKPFALLASRFEEIIMLDADVTYLRNPEELFEEEGYRKTGTFFFKDRTLNQGNHNGAKWLKSWMIDPLPVTKESRFWKETSEHEMDSSTVVIHKTKTLLGLLAVCKFNEYYTRYEVVYQKVLGDKETFWMGFDMARQPYHMNHQPSLFIGELDLEDESDKKLCGHVGHLSGDGKLLFWNGHLIKNKAVDLYAIQLLHFNAYVVDNYKEKKWSKDLSCLNLNGIKYNHFNKEDEETINEIIKKENTLHYVVKPFKTKEQIKIKNIEKNKNSKDKKKSKHHKKN